MPVRSCPHIVFCLLVAAGVFLQSPALAAQQRNDRERRVVQTTQKAPFWNCGRRIAAGVVGALVLVGGAYVFFWDRAPVPPLVEAEPETPEQRVRHFRANIDAIQKRNVDVPLLTPRQAGAPYSPLSGITLAPDTLSRFATLDGPGVLAELRKSGQRVLFVDPEGNTAANRTASAWNGNASAAEITSAERELKARRAAAGPSTGYPIVPGRPLWTEPVDGAVLPDGTVLVDASRSPDRLRATLLHLYVRGLLAPHQFQNEARALALTIDESRAASREGTRARSLVRRDPTDENVSRAAFASLAQLRAHDRWLVATAMERVDAAALLLEARSELRLSDDDAAYLLQELTTNGSVMAKGVSRIVNDPFLVEAFKTLEKFGPQFLEQSEQLLLLTHEAALRVRRIEKFLNDPRFAALRPRVLP